MSWVIDEICEVDVFVFVFISKSAFDLGISLVDTMV
jgi:hypothetical protein